MTDTIRCFVIREGHLLLGLIQTGSYRGQYTGFAGALQPNEEQPDAVRRILWSQATIKARHPLPAGTLIVHRNDREDERIIVYRVDEFEGQPHGAEGLATVWYTISQPLPYRLMSEDAPFWLPYLLRHRYFRGELWLGGKGRLVRHDIKTLP